MKTKKKNLRLEAYQTIKEEIVTLRLPPGTYLDTEKIQEKLNLGLTPVREALLRLEAENLVTSITNKGFYVKDLSMQSIKDLLENRMYLERYVGFLALKRITENGIEELEQLALEMKPLALKGKKYDVVMKDMEFHSLLVRSTYNSQLEKLMDVIYNESLRIWFFSRDEDLNGFAKMCLKIVNVLKRKSWKLLEKEIIHQNSIFQEKIVSYLKNVVPEAEFKPISIQSETNPISIN